MQEMTQSRANAQLTNIFDNLHVNHAMRELSLSQDLRDERNANTHRAGRPPSGYMRHALTDSGRRRYASLNTLTIACLRVVFPTLKPHFGESACCSRDCSGCHRDNSGGTDL